jgi:peptidoglycan hydrolase-like protein with peptidoglycan-binding domain
MALLRRGLTGEPVRMLQEKLGVNADGIFGMGTETALKEFQEQNGLEVDGIAGPDTFHAMDMDHLVLLHRPIRGQLVKKLQEGLGIDADGVFGGGTETAVRAFQEANGLEADGMAGPNTLALVPGFEIPEETIAQSLVTENTPDVDPAAVEQVRAEEPPPPEPGVVSKIGSAVYDAADAAGKAYANIGTSIWNTVKKIF